jgi:uncharacterized protein YoxC
MSYSLFSGMFSNTSTQPTNEELYNKVDYLQSKVETLETMYQDVLEKFNRVVEFLHIKDTYEYLFDGLSMMTNTQLKARTTKTELSTLSNIPNNKEKFCKAFLLTKLRRFFDECSQGKRINTVEEFANYVINHNDVIESVKQYFQANLPLVKVDIQNFMINHKDFFKND